MKLSAKAAGKRRAIEPIALPTSRSKHLQLPPNYEPRLTRGAAVWEKPADTTDQPGESLTQLERLELKAK